jgi:hypothetical protein
MKLYYPSDKKVVSALGTDRQIDFERWMLKLDEAHAKAGLPYGEGPLAMNTGVSCWLDFFNDGIEPDDALEEDLSNA